jgi:Zn-dependent protease with chaperone function
VSLNTANRSFFLLAATALVPFVLLGLLGCGVLSLIGYRLVEHGLAGLTDDGQDLRPALMFFAIVVGAAVLAARSAQRQIVATRALEAIVADRALPTPSAVASAASAAKVRVVVVEDAAPYSFTFGLWSPRVAVTSGLVSSATPAELQSVLHHERYHVRNRDTVKVVIARAAVSAFFFLPALRYLCDRYLCRRELAADRAATRETNVASLAGALLVAAPGPAWTDVGAAERCGGVLEQRIEQLEAGAEPPLARIPRIASTLTLLGGGALVGLFALTVAAAGVDVLAMDGSMPEGGGSAVMTVLGGLGCTAAMTVAAAMLVRGAAGHGPPR